MHLLFYPLSLVFLFAFFVIKDVPSTNPFAAIILAIVCFFLGAVAQALHQDTEKREADLKQALWDMSRDLEEPTSTADPSKNLYHDTRISEDFSISKDCLIYGSVTIPNEYLSIEIRDGAEGLQISQEYCQLVGQTWVPKSEIKGDFNRLYQTPAANNLWINESPKAEKVSLVNQNSRVTKVNEKTVNKESIRTVRCVNCGHSAEKPSYLASTLGKDFVKCPNCGMNFELSRQKN